MNFSVIRAMYFSLELSAVLWASCTGVNLRSSEPHSQRMLARVWLSLVIKRRYPCNAPG